MVYIFSIIVGLVICILYYFHPKKNKEYNQANLLMISALLAGLIVESIGDYTQKNNINNSLYYNLLFTYTETLIFIYFFYTIAISKRSQFWIKVWGWIFVVFGIVNSVFIQPIEKEFHNYSFVLGSFIILWLAICFFMDVLSFKRYKENNLLSIPYFWIVTVVLFFYSASFIYFSSVHILYTFHVSLLDSINLIVQVLAGFMYLVIGSAFFAPMIFKQYYHDE